MRLVVAPRCGRPACSPCEAAGSVVSERDRGRREADTERELSKAAATSRLSESNAQFGLGQNTRPQRFSLGPRPQAPASYTQASHDSVERPCSHIRASGALKMLETGHGMKGPGRGSHRAAHQTLGHSPTQYMHGFGIRTSSRPPCLRPHPHHSCVHGCASAQRIHPRRVLVVCACADVRSSA